jgi:hypothetical protein
MEYDHLMWATFPSGSSSPTSYAVKPVSSFEMGYAERHMLIETREGTSTAPTAVSYELLTFAEHKTAPTNFSTHKLLLPGGLKLADHLVSVWHGPGGTVLDEMLGYFVVTGKDEFFVFSYL